MIQVESCGTMYATYIARVLTSISIIKDLRSILSFQICVQLMLQTRSSEESMGEVRIGSLALFLAFVTAGDA